MKTLITKSDGSTIEIENVDRITIANHNATYDITPNLKSETFKSNLIVSSLTDTLFPFALEIDKVLIRNTPIP